MIDVLTQAEAARALGVTRSNVHRAVCAGTIRPCNEGYYSRGQAALFTPAEVERYRQERMGKFGRPRKASA